MKINQIEYKKNLVIKYLVKKNSLPNGNFIYKWRKGQVFLLDCVMFSLDLYWNNRKILDILESKGYSSGKSAVSDAIFSTKIFGWPGICTKYLYNMHTTKKFI